MSESEIIEITTDTTGRNVPFYKVTNSVLQVDIKGPKDAVIILTDEPEVTYTNIRCRIHICVGFENRKCWISKFGKPLAVTSNTLDIISSNEFRTFWVTWTENKICFGEPYKEPILVYDCDFDSDSLKYVGFRSLAVQRNTNLDIHWRFAVPFIIPREVYPIKGGQLVWVNYTNELPKNAIIGGVEDGNPLYVIRGKHRGSITPGKYSLLNHEASLPWGGREITIGDYEFLCGYDMQWVQSELAVIPPEAFKGGESEDRKEPLYVGRAKHEGHLIIGKVQRNHSVCYIPYKGREIAKQKYEILCLPSDDDEQVPIIMTQMWHVGVPDEDGFIRHNYNFS